MDLNEIKELIKLIDSSNLTTLELEREGFRILLKKEEKIHHSVQTGGGMAGMVPAGGLPNEKEQAPSAEAPKPYSNLPTINSPIVGTFYSAPSPEEKPFVQPGSSVKQGDTLCIIEAMKLMNDIEAEGDLQIVEVLVKDGEMVEYGQPLFVVKHN